MISLRGKPWRNCDGISRRNFLRAGALGIGALGLADLLRLESKAGIGSSTKAIIHIHLDGGPPQMDMIDLKPDAPVEIRGEFRPIPTALPGYSICEMMPQMAAMADRFIFIRSLVGAAGRHDAFQCQSGFDTSSLAAIGGRPAQGCVLTKLCGSPADPAPSFVDLMQGRALVRNSARPGYLGPSYQPFRPDISHLFSRPLEPGMQLELARLGEKHSIEMALAEGISAERLADRASLLGDLDRVKRALDASGQMDAMDRFSQQAASILTSGRFADALDLGKEDPRIVDRYTPIISGERHTTSDEPIAARKLLLARRLVEAGVRCVSLSFSDFDTHSNNFPRLRQILPMVDHAIATLVQDLAERGMTDDVTIVAWGEFGRTPKVNSKGGRDHWPQVGPAILAGGGMRVGQVIGATDRTASVATARPVHYQDVIATLYRNFGIDARRTTIRDTTGRPQYLVDTGQSIAEAI